MNNKQIIQQIKTQTKLNEFRDGMLAAHFICRSFARMWSVWFINHHVKPNRITVLMIIFGIIGSILFAIPNIWLKIFGYFFWILWFTMDCSDGQVARYTKTFSKYGTEMDYMAHLIDHPFMNLALWATFIEMGLFNDLVVSVVFIIAISVELITRNEISFSHYQKKVNPGIPKEIKRKSWIKYLTTELVLYPTLIVCLSWVFILDYWLKNGFSFYLYCILLLWTITLSVRSLIKTLIRYYKSE